MPRLFFALWPDAHTRAALDELAHRVPIKSGRRVPAAKLHLTLAFLGAVDEAKVAAVLAAGEGVRGAPFSLEFSSYGGWRGPRVAWLAPAVVPPELHSLVGKLRQGLAAAGLSSDDRPYRPHLTIARKTSREPVAGAVDPLVWRVAGFALVGSVTARGGPVYEVLGAWPLDVAGGD